MPQLLRLSAAFVVFAQLRAPLHHADSLRDGISRALSRAASASSRADQARHIAAARQLATEYSANWSDPFLIQQVDRFTRATAGQQRDAVAADSLRRAGISQMQSSGVPTAMGLWRAALSRAQRSGDRALVAAIRVAIGGGFYRLDQLDSATIYLRLGETEASRMGDRRTAANAIGILGSVAKDRGDLDGALSLYRRASRLRERSGDTRGMAADANNIGAIAQERGDLDAAAVEYQRALALNRKDGRNALVALNLDNLAGIATTRGDYTRAESYFREALSITSKLGARADAAFLLHGLGKLYISRGDYERAAVTLTEAMRIHDSTGAVAEGVEVRSDLAAVRAAMGAPDIARSLLIEAARDAQSADVPVQSKAVLAMTQADLAVEFGTFVDAKREYDRAASLYRSAGDSSGVANAIEGTAVLMHARGNDVSAFSLMKNAARIRSSTGNRRAASLSNLLLAEMQIAKDDFAAAKRTAVLASDGFRNLGDATGESAALAIVGDVYRRTGKLDSASRAYRLGLRRLGVRRASGVEWRLHSGLGQSLFRANDLEGAAAELRKAILVSEAAASGVRLEERRAGLNSDKWIAYRELALVELARGKAADAFSLSEKLRARQMVDLVSRGRVAFSGSSAREQDMRRRIASLTRELESDASTFQPVREPRLESRPVATVRAELDRAQREYAAELARVREKDPSYARFVSGTTRSWKEIASRLSRDQVLIEYLLTDSASIAFVVTRDTVAAIDLKTDHDRIANLVEFARRAVEKPARPGSRRIWQVPLRRLYATLIEPIESKGYLRGKTSLLIAPHSELHFLSFASLVQPQTNRFLVDRYDISYTPSATVWAQLKDRPVRVVPAGVLALAPNIQRLPATKEEVGAISRIYGRRVVVKTGRDATSQALRTGLRNAGTIHLATFGVLNKHNPLFSFIELAPDSRSDGHLDVSEVFGLPMSGQLVVLSACQTAVGSGALADVPEGDDWVSLVQAFLQAGANTVVASLWPVEDRATADLMTRFHLERSRGVSSAAAIARAQRSAIRNPKTADPFYWAAFAASGRVD